ncbi:MAG: ABC transporter permease [Chloroflexota bacterium]|nr:ABC transporter permease [Chloroflexota bacterium]
MAIVGPPAGGLGVEDKALVAELETGGVSVSGGTDIFRGRRASVIGYLGLPVALLAVCAILFLWLGAQDLGSIERRLINPGKIATNFVEHMGLTFVSTVFVILIAIPLGVLLTRPAARPLVLPIVNVANIGQAVPSIGVLVLLALIWTVGFWPAIVALVVYSILPVLRNTMVGLQQVDQSVIEAGRGMGMTKGAVLRRIELPLAVPVILAGVRTALVINVGTATLATFVNAGGLGEIIAGGIVTNRQTVVLTGSVLTAVVALFIDHLGGIAEGRLSPKGL